LSEARVRVVNVRTGEPFDEYIGRPMFRGRHRLRGSPYANPFRLRNPRDDAERARVLAAFDAWVRTSDEPGAAWVREHVHELRGKTLACWCAPAGGLTAADPLVCHGQILAAMADAPAPTSD
jgi:hypothetical protein